jgi:hypothetical protein
LKDETGGRLPLTYKQGKLFLINFSIPDEKNEKNIIEIGSIPSLLGIVRFYLIIKNAEKDPNPHPIDLRIY